MRVKGDWLQLSEIVMVNLILSGDNALLIAMATSKLPARQRRLAMVLGIVGAMLLRMILTGIAAELILLPFVRAVGALLLIVMAVKLIDAQQPQMEIANQGNLWSAAGTILLADLTMSLDNVAALAGMAEGNLGLLMVGLVISMACMLMASVGISKILERFPSLLVGGAGILAWTAGRILAEDTGVSHVAGQHMWIMLLVISVIFLLVSLVKSFLTRENSP